MAIQKAVGAWERLALYYAVESAWGDPIEATTGWHRLRETTMAVPSRTKQTQFPGAIGSGLPYDEYDYTVDSPARCELTTNHPLTAIGARDLFGLLSNAHDSGGAAPTDWQEHDVAALAEHATLIAKTQSSGTGSAYQGTSCFVTGITVDIPQSSAGESSGLCTMGVTWLGYDGDEIDAQDVGTVSTDTGAQLLSADCTFGIGAAEHLGMVSASLNFSNNAALLPVDATGYATGAVMGRSTLTGNVVVLDIEDAGARVDLQAAYEAKSNLVLSWDFGTTAFHASVVIGKPGDPQDIGGAIAYSFPFTLAGDSTNNPKAWKVVVPALADSIFYNA